MKVETSKELKVKLKGNDADNFKSALKKIAEESKTLGFKKSNLNEEELKVIQSLSDMVNDCEG